MAQPIAQPMALPSTSRGGDDAIWNGVGNKRTLDASMTAEDLGVDAIGVPAKKRKKPNKKNRRGGSNKRKGKDDLTWPSTEPPSTIQVYRSCGAKSKADTTIFSLPLELLAEIFSYLRTQDLLALARTSKPFCHTLVASESESLRQARRYLTLTKYCWARMGKRKQEPRNLPILWTLSWASSNQYYCRMSRRSKK